MGKEKNMKLEEVLGAELYAQVKAKIDEVNANETDKLKHVRYADLSEGEYVGKGKYDSEIEKLNNIISGKDTELTTANDLIAQLKKGTKGNEELQGKITQYEQQNAQLQEQLKETKIRSAIKVALLSEKAVDVDYLTYKLNEKLKEKGETLELDENDNIKGWNDKLAGLKTQFPTMFESTSKDGGGYTRMDDGKLPGGDDHNTLTRSEILKKPYAERAKLFEENPEAYNAAMNSK
nr:MAG TPA: minor structural protein [Caudoviricetes sp.]